MPATRLAVIGLATLAALAAAAQQPRSIPERSRDMPQTNALRVAVGRPRIIMRQANYPYMVQFADGSIVVSAKTSPTAYGQVRSGDGGDTWRPWQTSAPLGIDGTIGRLADGTILVIGQRTELAAGAAPGVYTGQRWLLTDNGNKVSGPEPITVETPPVAAGYNDGGAEEANRVRGPFFHGDFVVMPNGDLLTTMDTNFPADTKYPKTGEMYKWRTIVVRSSDQGRHWRYLSTAAAMDSITDPKQVARWQDGFDEASLGLMPDGQLLCVMRTGTYSASAPASETYHDLANTVVEQDGKYRTRGEPTDPIYLATSRDGGQTWAPPRPLPTARGACPRLLRLSNGVLALSYGRVARPTQGDRIVFSLDGGQTWTNDTEIFAGLSSGYTQMVESAPGRILYVFDSVTAWGPKYTPDWIGAVDIEVAPPGTTVAPGAAAAVGLGKVERLTGPGPDGTVLSAGPAGSFDAAWVGWADAAWDGQTYHLWYAGSQVDPGYSGDVAAIGLATSRDGLHWERANGGKPVFEPGPEGTFDDQQVGGQSVLRDGRLWRMWYHGLKKPAAGGSDMNFRIGLATSRDGVRWTRENGGQPVLDLGPPGSYDDTQVANPAVIREGDGYRMWYSAYSQQSGHTIAMAQSPDGVHWTRCGTGPVEGLGRWVLGPSVCRIGDEYLMLYSREDLEEHAALHAWYVAAATSRDGLHWRVLNGGQPIAGWGAEPPLGGGVHHPSRPVLDGASVRYWYTENLARGVFRLAAGRLELTGVGNPRRSDR